jgi:hypothetical protein
METLVQNIILESIGVVDKKLNINPIRRIQIKDIFDYHICLYVHKNTVKIYAFDKEESSTPNVPMIGTEYPYENVFAKYIYSMVYYRLKFRPLTYSMDVSGNLYKWDLETYINVYSYKDIPKEYYKFTNDLFNNLKVISVLLYKEELEDYISTFEKINI